MNEFIEVHVEGKRHLINTRWIEEICNNTIYFAFSVPDAVEQDYLKTDETYEQLKELIWR